MRVYLLPSISFIYIIYSLSLNRKGFISISFHDSFLLFSLASKTIITHSPLHLPFKYEYHRYSYSQGSGFIWDCSHQGNFQQMIGCQNSSGIKDIKRRTFQAIITAVTKPTSLTKMRTLLKVLCWNNIYNSSVINHIVYSTLREISFWPERKTPVKCYFLWKILQSHSTTDCTIPKFMMGQIKENITYSNLLVKENSFFYSVSLFVFFNSWIDYLCFAICHAVPKWMLDLSLETVELRC